MSKTKWWIDPVSFALVSDHPTRAFTQREVEEQEWPPCPVCGRVIDVPAIDIQEVGNRFPKYIPGQWQCPRGCDPSVDTPPAVLTAVGYAGELQGVADRYWPDAGVVVSVVIRDVHQQR